MNKIFLWILVIILGGAGASYLYQKYRIAPELDFDKIEFSDLQSHPVSLSSYKRQKVLVCFFATWCGPCVHEITLLEQARSELQNAGVSVVLIGEDTPVRLQRFQSQYNVTFPILVSTKPFKDLGVMTYPTSYVLNAKGRVVFKQVDFTNWSSDEMMKKLRSL